MVFVNTVEFCFGNQPSLMLREVHCWLSEIGITMEQIDGVAVVHLTASKTIRLKFKKGQDYQEFMLKWEGDRVVTIGNLKDIRVTIKVAGSKESFFRVLNIPLELDDNAIKRKFETYGKVTGVRREKYFSTNPEEGFFPILTGVTILRMFISTHIPSLLRMGGERVQARYQGQPLTCFKCGKTGHFGAQCEEKKQPTPQFPGRWAEKRTYQAKQQITANGVNEGSEVPQAEEVTDKPQNEAEPSDQSVISSRELPNQDENQDKEVQGGASSMEETLIVETNKEEYRRPEPNDPSYPFLYGTGSFDSSPLKTKSYAMAIGINQPDFQAKIMETIVTEDQEPGSSQWLAVRQTPKRRQKKQIYQPYSAKSNPDHQDMEE